MKKFILTEKPSVAIDLSKVLPGPFERKDGYLEGSSLILSWAYGHLVGECDPAVYNPAFTKWELDVLPIIPDLIKLSSLPGKEKQLSVIKTLAHREDVSALINACDAAREGELIFRRIYTYLNLDKPVERLWLSETTEEAIKKAFSDLQPAANFDKLGYAAEARSRADWVIGINGTRGLTCHYKEKLTVGRVQTPTLALIVNRDQAIKDFKAEPFYEVHANFKNDGGNYSGIWQKDDIDRFDNKAAAEAIIKELVPGTQAVVKDVVKERKSQYAPKLYNLIDLQKEGNEHLGLTADQVLNIAQKLYEAKLITYPRTDSRYLTQSMAATLPHRLKSLEHTDLAPFLDISDFDLSNNRRYVDDSKVNDHTAIIITTVKPDFLKMDKSAADIYFMIARRLLAIFYPPAQLEKVTISTETAGHIFVTKGKNVLTPGWTSILPEQRPGEENNQDKHILPEVTQGQQVIFLDSTIESKKTTAPKRYTDASLLSSMENAGRNIDDDNLKDVMKGKGLGTPATRAAIIEKLISTGYIIRDKKGLKATEKGFHLLEVVEPQLADPLLTAEWENKLSEIENGSQDQALFMDEIKAFTTEIIDNIRALPEVVSAPVRDSIGVCPLCGGAVKENTKSYFCVNWKTGCKFSIWKERSGKKISSSQAKKLLSKGKTDLIKGFKPKDPNGKPFDAYLVLNDGQVLFEFPKG